MKAMGIDIGTTTISVIMLDAASGKLFGSRTISHGAFMEGTKPFHRIQQPELLYEKTKEAAGELAMEHGKPDSIGFTGQMHGMLYVNSEGMAASPLYTWQDESGSESFREDMTYAQVLKEKTGRAATGYGITTHFYLSDKKEIPEEAVKMATISDYIAMRMCGQKEPMIAKDMAASWGCFDLEKGSFLTKELEELGISCAYLPRICEGHEIIGKAVISGLEGVPVMASLGDNQASFIGSVQSISDTMLLNIGTGSQVSFGMDRFYQTAGAIELRPCTADTYILAGAGLCGGRAYAMLEQFYQQAAGELFGIQESKMIYPAMERSARAFLKEYGKDAAWKIQTIFCGTRTNPQERGSISSIGVENFTPGAMNAGMILGILNELYEMYEQMCRMSGKRAAYLVGSGNGLRQNKLMQELAEEMFGMSLKIPECEEEAAYGAALHSLVSAGLAASLEEVQQKIRYQGIS